MFRQNESAAASFERAKSYLIDRLGPDVTRAEKNRSLVRLREIEEKLGPVVDAYPMWHPLVSHYPNAHSPTIRPCEENGYQGLDHPIYFRNGFITCPYVNPESVLHSVENIPRNAVASIKAKLVDDVYFYHKSAHPVLVQCDWIIRPIATNEFIGASVAAPLMMEQVLKKWHDSRFDESWDTMRPYILGQPHGATSSHFIEKQTGFTLRNLYNSMVKTGMYGG